MPLIEEKKTPRSLRITYGEKWGGNAINFRGGLLTIGLPSASLADLNFCGRLRQARLTVCARGVSAARSKKVFVYADRSFAGPLRCSGGGTCNPPMKLPRARTATGLTSAPPVNQSGTRTLSFLDSSVVRGLVCEGGGAWPRVSIQRLAASWSPLPRRLDRIFGETSVVGM